MTDKNLQHADAQLNNPKTATSMLLPLAMAQFLASYDTSSMNVAISNIVADLDTTVTGVQSAISLFTLVMAALMIPGSKLTDIVGRKTCFVWGIAIYGTGALITSLSPSLGVMIVGWSFLEGIGSALMIPPVYILTTVSYPDIKSRARAFAVISAMAGLGSATGPLIGGLITTAFTWRLSFAMEVMVCLVIIYFSRRIPKSAIPSPRPSLDVWGTVLSGAGLVAIVLGVLLAGDYGWILARQAFSLFGSVVLPQGGVSPVVIFIAVGAVLLLLFYLHIRSMEKKNRTPLLSTRLFHNRTSNLGLVTQNIQWLIMLGTFFVISVYLQVSRELTAVQTGLVLTAVTAGLLLTSAKASALARKFTQKNLIAAGFIATIGGMALNLVLVPAFPSLLAFIPGLFLIGSGIGIMLTASVNVVQSSVPEKDQGEISGLSRSVSNLGSSLGVSIAGAILISSLFSLTTSLTESSTVLNQQQKQSIADALEENVNTLSDTQIRSVLQGQPQEVVDEVVKINAEARNRALARAQIGMIIIGLLGLLAALLLPPEPGAKKKSVPVP